ncbi:MAG TPA: PEP-CTERM sorting domain-containing protein [Nitrospira sp.]|nr:PEP-CTERM sorting domain-containing protein [Nitrospira sp.]
MVLRQYVTGFLFAALMFPLSVPASALSLTGYIEGTAANGWQGTYAVQLPVGMVTTGTGQVSLLSTFSSIPLVTKGCAVSPSCVSVTNVATSDSFTMTNLTLHMGGTATLGSLGTLSWAAQPLWVLPGNPSQTVAVLTQVSGTLAGTNLTGPPSPFDFNGTLTARFNSVTGGQALNSVRIDFSDGTPPLRSNTLRQGNAFFDIGVPIALGTPLAVPEPSALLLLGLSIAGVLGLHWKQLRITCS